MRVHIRLAMRGVGGLLTYRDLPQIMKSETSRISHDQQTMKEKIKVRKLLW